MNSIASIQAAARRTSMAVRTATNVVPVVGPLLYDAGLYTVRHAPMIGLGVTASYAAWHGTNDMTTALAAPTAPQPEHQRAVALAVTPIPAIVGSAALIGLAFHNARALRTVTQTDVVNAAGDVVKTATSSKPTWTMKSRMQRAVGVGGLIGAAGAAGMLGPVVGGVSGLAGTAAGGAVKFLVPDPIEHGFGAVKHAAESAAHRFGSLFGTKTTPGRSYDATFDPRRPFDPERDIPSDLGHVIRRDGESPSRAAERALMDAIHERTGVYVEQQVPTGHAAR